MSSVFSKTTYSTYSMSLSPYISQRDFVCVFLFHSLHVSVISLARFSGCVRTHVPC